MVTIYLLCALGLGLAWVVYDEIADDDDSTAATGPEPEPEPEPTEGDDILVGTDGADTLSGGAGNDDISGGAGNDDLSGGTGSDTMDGGGGWDVVMGDGGNDLADGGSGDDAVTGGKGNDTVSGQAGHDWVDGGNGDDVVTGNSGDDAVIGGTGEDELEGGEGDDLLVGGKLFSRDLTMEELSAMRDIAAADGDADLPDGVGYAVTDDGDADTISGANGDDTLILGDGDSALGGDGEDLFYLLGGVYVDPAQLMDFDAADDTLTYVHDAGTPQPTLALTDNGDGTQTLTADGNPVAVLNTAAGLALGDIAFYERGSDPSFVM